jgi:hypothetical protein
VVIFKRERRELRGHFCPDGSWQDWQILLSLNVFYETVVKGGDSLCVARCDKLYKSELTSASPL